MLAQIPDRIRSKMVLGALTLSALAALSSCATKPEPQLVSDGTTGHESSIPWNQQQKWETEGQFAGMGDRISDHR